MHANDIHESVAKYQPIHFSGFHFPLWMRCDLLFWKWALITFRRTQKIEQSQRLRVDSQVLSNLSSKFTNKDLSKKILYEIPCTLPSATARTRARAALTAHSRTWRANRRAQQHQQVVTCKKKRIAFEFWHLIQRIPSVLCLWTEWVCEGKWVQSMH